MFRRKGITANLLLCLIGSSLMAVTAPAPVGTVPTIERMPLAFTKNMGQWDDRVLYRANASGITLWFTKDGVIYQLTRRKADSTGESLEGGAESDHNPAISSGKSFEKGEIEQLVLTAKFVGANPSPEVVGERQMEYKCNYFLGDDPSKWRTDVPNYGAITIKDMYLGVDMKYSGGRDGQVAYEFITARGVDLAQVKVSYEGADSVFIDDGGKTLLRTQWGDFAATMESPTAGITFGSAGLRTSSQGNAKNAPGSSGQQALVALPVVIAYSNVLGGTDGEEGYGIAHFGGNAYVAGVTNSAGFPTTVGAYDQTKNVNSDAFVAAFSSSGALLFSTFLGGDGGDFGQGIAVEENHGTIHVVGSTTSTNFPMLIPYQTDQGDGDVFVTKLTSSGNALVHSTYLGGASADHGSAIAVDENGYAYVTGHTWSSNFPTVPVQTHQGSWDAFVTKIDSSGTSLVYSNLLGGGGSDRGLGIALYGTQAYVTGNTLSSNFPTLNPVQSDQGGEDAFVTKFSALGGKLYSTYLGGEGSDDGRSIAVDGSGRAYVTGFTNSTGFPTLNAYQPAFGGGTEDAYVTKLNSSGGNIMYSTYLGGSNQDLGFCIAVDVLGNAYVTGYTWSSNFPTLNSFQSARPGNEDAFVTKLSSSGNSLAYSTYLGGGNLDNGSGIAVDGNGSVYVTGQTASSDFPTVPDQTLSGYFDIFVTKLTGVCGDLQFRPNPNGWQFCNCASNIWPQSWWQQFDYCQPPYPPGMCALGQSSDFPDWPLWVSAFGENQCYLDPPTNSIYRPSAVGEWHYYKGPWGGSCFGFAVSSLLFYDDFLALGTEFPGNAEVYQVPIDDQSRMMQNKYWVYQLGMDHMDHIYLAYVSMNPTQTLLDCQAMFNAVPRDDRVLVLFNNHGNGGHAINPYRCEVDPGNPDLSYIYVYDNNYPGNSTMRVVVNTLSNTWTYSGLPGWGGTGGLKLIDPISAYTSTPIMPKALATREKLIGGSARTISQHVRFFLPSTGDAILKYSTDSIGYRNDSLFGDVADGAPIIPITGQETPPIGYHLPNAPWDVRLSGMIDTSIAMAVMTDSAQFQYSRQGVSGTQTDRFRYGGNDSSMVVFNPDAGSRTYDLQVISIHPDSEFVLKIGGIVSETSDSNRFAITNGSRFRIDNYGATSIYDIRVEIASRLDDTVFFHQDVTISGNSSHIIRPDWRPSHDSLHILVDNGMNGSIDDSLVISNEGELSYICGDANGNGAVNISDAVSLIAYIFAGGLAPDPLLSGDANCDGTVNISDAVYLIAYIFAGGAAPCSACK